MRFLAISLFVTTLFSTGCVTYWKGKEITADVAALQGQVEQLTESQRTHRERFERSSTELDARLAKFETTLVEAIEKLRTNSADSGVVIDELQKEIALLRGELATFQHKVRQDGPQGPPVVEPPSGGPQLPSDRVALYKYGHERWKAGECAEAVRAFMQLADKHPDYDFADNALALAAECQLRNKEHGASLRTLKIITQKYKKGDKMDDALVLMADNFAALGQCQRAVLFLETVVKDHPTSNRLKEAKRKLRKTKAACKN